MSRGCKWAGGGAPHSRVPLKIARPRVPNPARAPLQESCPPEHPWLPDACTPAPQSAFSPHLCYTGQRLASEISAEELPISWDSADGQRVTAATGEVTYVAGGFEGLSHAALIPLVRTRCMERVAGLTCSELSTTNQSSMLRGKDVTRCEWSAPPSIEARPRAAVCACMYPARFQPPSPTSVGKLC